MINHINNHIYKCKIKLSEKIFLYNKKRLKIFNNSFIHSAEYKIIYIDDSRWICRYKVHNVYQNGIGPLTSTSHV